MTGLEIVIEEIDRVLGAGYAKRNPVLMASMLLARSLRFDLADILARAIEDEGDVVSAALRSISSSVAEIGSAIHNHD